MTESNFDQIRRRFWDAYETLRDLSDEEILSGPYEVFEPAYAQLRDLGTVNPGGDTASTCSKSYFQNIGVRLIHLIEMIEQRFELDAARLVNASADVWESLKTLPSYAGYVEEVRMEYFSADLKKGDKVVFLGSGPLPMTPILFYQEHGVESVGIEKNSSHAELSQDIINRLGLSDHVKIVKGDHFSLPLRQKFELLLLAYRAEPKEEIFGHLAKVLEDRAKVGYRVPEKSSNGHLSLADLLVLIQHNGYFRSNGLPSGFREYCRVPPEPPNVYALVMTIKEATATS